MSKTSEINSNFKILDTINISDIYCIKNIDKFKLIAEYDESWKKIFDDSRLTTEINIINSKFESIPKNIILPNDNSVLWNAFKLTPFPPKIIILGQDPYTHKNEAMGLSFSVPIGVKIPRSLSNIFKELHNDIEGFQIPSNGDLTYLAKQGVLLLNASLTVKEGGPSNDHSLIWNKFTDTLIQLICEKSNVPCVWLLWGNNSKSKKKFITNSHKILESVHPSPLSAQGVNGTFFGNNHFSQANAFLYSKNITPIDWINT